ncbi:MAG: hypothetical protein SGPRY_012065 [Prymnesium sp.]
MESSQPSGSFKDRGMAHLCSTLKQTGVSSLICSSGGNAGLAVAAMARKLEMSAHVIVPETTKAIMLDKIRAHGAHVTVHGANWNEADKLARSLVAEDQGAEYIPPYEHPLLWEGHSSLVDELVEAGVKPGAVVASVGGGGLLCGIALGMQRHGWNDTRLIAAETHGANCLAAAVAAGEPVKLDAITSIATSLGALQCSPTALKLFEQHKGECAMVTDEQAVRACAQMLSHHRVLVEPACGAAIAAALHEPQRSRLSDLESVVIVVCGGSGVDFNIMEQWRADGLWE